MLLLVVSCRRAPTHDAGTIEEAKEPPAPRVELAPLAGEWLEPLVDEDGRGLGSVAIPTGAREPRRIAVAVHGAAGRPDFMCGAVRACIGPEAFVVCPHPVASWISEASWSSAAQIRERIEAAVDAVVSRFGPYVDRTDALYFGHSQGRSTHRMPCPSTTRAGQHSATRSSSKVYPTTSVLRGQPSWAPA